MANNTNETEKSSLTSRLTPFVCHLAIWNFFERRSYAYDMRPYAHTDEILRRIYFIRGHRVMLDSDLAELYGVSTRRLNEQVRRNIKRFPKDFMFGLEPKEFKILMSQIATSKPGSGGRRKLPLVFTREGVAMLSGVLHSNRAIETHIAIMRAFIELRETLLFKRELTRRLIALEHKTRGHDIQIRDIFDALQELIKPAVEETPKKIGFNP